MTFMGKPRDQLIQEATVTADFGLLALNSPELNAQVKEAIGTFMRDPGFIQIELRPEAPVSVQQLMPLLGTPGEIVKLMKVSVTAGPN